MEEKGFKFMELLKNPIAFLKRKIMMKRDYIFIAVANPILSQEGSESGHESNKMKIIDLETQHEEVVKKNQNFSNQLQDSEAYCESLENEIASLICELEKANNQLSQYQKLEKSTKILDEILTNQR